MPLTHQRDPRLLNASTPQCAHHELVPRCLGLLPQLVDQARGMHIPRNIASADEHPERGLPACLLAWILLVGLILH